MSSSLKFSLASAGALLFANPAFAQVSAVVPVPEPAGWTIMALGVVGVAIAAYRKHRK